MIIFTYLGVIISFVFFVFSSVLLFSKVVLKTFNFRLPHPLLTTSSRLSRNPEHTVVSSYSYHSVGYTGVFVSSDPGISFISRLDSVSRFFTAIPSYVVLMIMVRFVPPFVILLKQNTLYLYSL